MSTWYTLDEIDPPGQTPPLLNPEVHPPQPPSPSYFEGIGAGVGQAVESVYGGAKQALGGLFGIGHQIDLGLGKLSDIGGSPMGAAPFSEQAAAAFTPTIVQTFAPLGLEPKQQEYAEAAVKPLVQTVAGAAVDPIMYVPFGGLAKFGPAGKAVGAAISAGFAGQMGTAAYEAAQKAKQLFDEQGVTPETVSAASQFLADAGFAGLGAVGAVSHLGQLRAPKAAPEPPAPRTPEALASATEHLNNVARRAEAALNEEMSTRAAARAEGASTTGMLAEARKAGLEIPKELTIEELMRRETPSGIPSGEDIAHLAPGQAPPRIKLNVLTQEMIDSGQLPPVAERAARGAKAFADQAGNIYITPKTAEAALRAKTPQEAVNKILTAVEHEVSHLFSGGAQGEPLPQRAFDPFAGREVTGEFGKGKPEAERVLLPSGRAKGGHALGETYQDIPRDLTQAARQKALGKILRENPRLKRSLEVLGDPKSRQYKEIAAALEPGRAGESILGDLEGQTYTTEVGELIKAAVPGAKVGRTREPAGAKKAPTLEFEAMGREEPKRPEAEIVKDAAHRWRAANFEERLGVYQRLKEMGGLNKINLEKLGITTEEWRSFQTRNTANFHQQRQKGSINPKLQAAKDIWMDPKFRGKPSRELGTSPAQLGVSPRQEAAIAAGTEAKLPPSRQKFLGPTPQLMSLQKNAFEARRAALEAKRSGEPARMTAAGEKLSRVGQLVANLREKFGGVFRPGQKTSLDNIARGVEKQKELVETAAAKSRKSAEAEAARAFKEKIRTAKESPELIALRKEVAALREEFAGRRVKKPKQERVAEAPKKGVEEIEAEAFKPGEGGEFEMMGAERPRIKSAEEKALENERRKLKGFLKQVRETKRGQIPVPSEAKLDQLRQELGKPLPEKLAALREERTAAEKRYQEIKGEGAPARKALPEVLREGAKRLPGREVKIPGGRTRVIPRGGLGLELPSRKLSEKELLAREALGEEAPKGPYQPKTEVYPGYEGPERPSVSRLVPEGPKRAMKRGGPTPKKRTEPKAAALGEEALKSLLPRQLEKLRLSTSTKQGRFSRIPTNWRDVLKLKKPSGESYTVEEAKALAAHGRKIGSNAIVIGDEKTGYTVKSLRDILKGAAIKEAPPAPRLALGERAPTTPRIPGAKGAKQALTGYILDRRGEVKPSPGGAVTLEDIAKVSTTKAAFSARIDPFIDGLQKRGLLSPGESTVEYRRRALNYFDKQYVKTPPPEGGYKGERARYEGWRARRAARARAEALFSPKGDLETMGAENLFPQAGRKPKREPDIYEKAGRLKYTDTERVRTIKKELEWAAEKTGVAKSIVTGGDLSNPLRQTLVLTSRQAFENPTRLKNNILEMIKSYSKGRYEKYDAELKARPAWEAAKKSGVNLIDKPSQHDAFLGVDLIDNALKKYLAKPWTDPRKWLAEAGEKWTVGASRAYTHYQNLAMVDAFAAGDAMLRRAGQHSPEALKDVANLVNVFGSRTPVEGTLGKVGNVFLFSPQMLKARTKALAYVLLDHGVKNKPDGMPDFTKPIFTFRSVENPAVRSWARRLTLETIGFGGSLLALGYSAALAAGKKPSIEADSRSAQFLKLKVGHTTLDPWGGYQQYLRLVAQLYTGEEKLSGSGRIQEAKRGELLARFGRSKLSPVAGLGASFLTGSTAEGREAKSPQGRVRTIKDAILPLVASDSWDLIKDNQGVLTVPFILATLFGAGVQAGPGARGSWITSPEHSAQDVRVSDEIRRLKLEPPHIGTRVTLPGRTSIGERRYYSLTSEEREKFRNEVMPFVSKELDEVISSERYQSLPDEAKRRLLFRAVKIENRKHSANRLKRAEFRSKPAKNEWWGKEEQED